KSKLPKTDSIAMLADFWDTHDVTDFEDELEEVAKPVFARSAAIEIHLPAREAALVKKLARAKGIAQEELVRSWVLRQLERTNGHRSKKPRKSKSSIGESK